MVDKITLEHALTDNPFWMTVYVTEPMREIEVKMTYSELMAIKKLWDNNRDNKWHSIDDRLPDEEGEYIVTDGLGGYAITEYCTDIEDGEFVGWFDNWENAVAWMPIKEWEENI